MSRKSVAVLDIRSSEITVIVGERGVNRTFIFKASRTEPYEGYDENGFFDKDKLAEAVFRAIGAVEKTCNASIKEIFVGVPGDFSTVLTKQQVSGFPGKRKIGKAEIDGLFEAGREELEGYRFIRATSMIYITGDNRRVIDPVGLTSTSLVAALSYFYCTDYFAQTIEGLFKNMKINVRFLPTELAMASYLIPSETRDETAFFLDSGFLSSTVSMVLGNGVLCQRNFWVGRVNIIVRLMEAFSLSFEAAGALLQKANLYAKSGAKKAEFVFGGETYEIEPDKVTEIVKEGLDMLCEAVGGFLEECSSKELDYKPLYITGEGITEIRGALEHVSKRISRVVEAITPELPYYNKPTMSSRIALIDMAYEDRSKEGILNRIFKGFGG